MEGREGSEKRVTKRRIEKMGSELGKGAQGPLARELFLQAPLLLFL